MNNVKMTLTKIVLGAVALVTLAAMLPSSASATRYAVAYGEFVEGCGTTPGAPCPKT